MNIETGDLGSYRTEDTAEGTKLRLIVPVRFTEVSSLRTPVLQQIVLTSAWTGNHPLRTSAPVALVGTRTGGAFEVPQPLRPEDGDANGIQLNVELFSEDPLHAKSEGTVALRVDIQLAHSTAVSFEISCRLLTGGVLKVETMKRMTPRPPIVRHLLLSLALAGGVLFWNSRVNVNIHEGLPFFSQSFVATAVGALLGFLGLSFLTTQRLVQSLPRLRGLLEIPEFHFERSTASVLADSSFSKVLAFVTLLIVAYVSLAWPLELTARRPFLVVDTAHDDSPVSATRAYWWHVPKFGIRCVDFDSVEHAVGSFDRSLRRAAIRLPVVAVDYPSHLANEPSPVVASMDSMLSFKLAHDSLGLLKSALCLGGTYEFGNGYVLRPDSSVVLGNQEVEAGFTIARPEPVDPSHLLQRLRDFRDDRLQPASASTLWANRNVYTVQASDVIRSQLLTPSTVLVALDSIWGEIVFEDQLPTIEQALEGAILARAIASAYSSHHHTSFTMADVKELTRIYQTYFPSAIQARLTGRENVRYDLAIRAQWEALLELRKGLGGADLQTRPAQGIEAAIVGEGTEWHRWSGGFAILLLRACIHTGQCIGRDLPTHFQRFWRHRWPAIQETLRNGYTPTARGLADYILEKEEGLPENNARIDELVLQLEFGD